MAYIELDGGLIIETDTPQHWTEGKRLSNAEGKRKHREYARARLLEMLKPGDTIYTVLRHVSRSGMSRRIDLYKVKDGENLYLTGYAATVIGASHPAAHGGLRMDGCGSDMGFEAVYQLGCALWPNGTPEPHGTRNGEPDSEGGYALKHRWL